MWPDLELRGTRVGFWFRTSCGKYVGNKNIIMYTCVGYTILGSLLFSLQAHTCVIFQIMLACNYQDTVVSYSKCPYLLETG